MPLDIAPLTNATNRLREGLARYNLDISDEQIRDGLIQRFEFTYELSHKMLKRFMEQTAGTPDEFDQMEFSTLIRTGNERGLLKGEWPDWKEYRGKRARSSHTYDVKVALEVVAIIPAFLAEAEFLCAEIARRQG